MKLVRPFTTRPRLLLSAAFAVMMGFILPDHWTHRVISRALIGWDAGVCLYLVLTAEMIWRSTPGKLLSRAREHDEGALMILAMVIMSALASLGSIIGELAIAKDMHGIAKTGHIALAGITVVTSWLFTHLMFALHYAHDYHLAQTRGQPGGLDFPGPQQPDYGDFLYFSVVIGISGQTADVAFTSRAMRRVGMVHCLLAFVFNTALLALSVNIAAGLL